MKAGAKEYLLSKFDRHELRGKAAGEPARATGKVPRMGPAFSPNFNRGIVERAYESLSLREKGFLFDHASQARAGVAPAGVQCLSRRTVTATTGRVEAGPWRR